LLKMAVAEVAEVVSEALALLVAAGALVCIPALTARVHPVLLLALKRVLAVFL
jgi:hypothetical protein